LPPVIAGDIFDGAATIECSALVGVLLLLKD
jgi:hypothetical protein